MMGPGGGTGGNNATSTAVGAAATAVSATTIAGFDTDINRVYFQAGELGSAPSGCVDGGGATVSELQGGNGADGTESFNGDSFYINGKNTGGHGGIYPGCLNHYTKGTGGVITIWEYF